VEQQEDVHTGDVGTVAEVLILIVPGSSWQVETKVCIMARHTMRPGADAVRCSCSTRVLNQEHGSGHTSMFAAMLWLLKATAMPGLLLQICSWPACEPYSQYAHDQSS
jgi:hypothetical protein